MNLVLFEASELHYPLARSDRRVRHILDVLRRPVGAPFDAGVINGPRGQATLLALGPEAVTFAFTPLVPALPRSPITLIIGLPRPQTARDILRDATTLGADAIHFVRLENPSAATRKAVYGTAENGAATSSLGPSKPSPQVYRR